MNASKAVLALAALALAASLAAGQTQPRPVGGEGPFIPGLPEAPFGVRPPPSTQPAEVKETTFSILVAWDPQRMKLDAQWAGFLDGYQPEERWGVVGGMIAAVPVSYALISRLGLRLEPLAPADWPKKPPVHTASGPAPDLPPLPAGWKAARIEGKITQTLRPELESPGDPLERAAALTERKFSVGFLQSLYHWLDVMDYLPESKEIEQKAQNAVAKAENRRGSASAVADKEVPQIDQDLRALTLDELGKRYRVEAISRQIDRLKLEAKDRLDRDPIATQLRRVLELRAEALQGVTSKVNAALKAQTMTQADAEQMVKEAELKVVEGQIQLAQREEAVLAGASGELLTRLSSDQAMLMIDLSEIRAKAQYLQNRKGELQQAAAAAQQEVTQAERQYNLSLPWRVVHEKWKW